MLHWKTELVYLIEHLYSLHKMPRNITLSIRQNYNFFLRKKKLKHFKIQMQHLQQQLQKIKQNIVGNWLLCISINTNIARWGPSSSIHKTLEWSLGFWICTFDHVELPSIICKKFLENKVEMVYYLVWSFFLVNEGTLQKWWSWRREIFVPQDILMDGIYVYI